MNLSAVRDLVVGYRPYDSTEAEFRVRLLDLVSSVDDPWNRERFDPGHLTASAFALHPDGHSVALVHHAKLDRWLQPGGHVEHDDATHESAARRELAEECLIDSVDSLGVIDLDIHRFPERAAQPAHLHFDLRWAFRARHPNIGSGDGTLDARWVPLDELASMEEDGLVRTALKLRELR
jgi:8-oxo-dGTP pyrophosphatase MutT (NUDIX family)